MNQTLVEAKRRQKWARESCDRLHGRQTTAMLSRYAVEVYQQLAQLPPLFDHMFQTGYRNLQVSYATTKVDLCFEHRTCQSNTYV